MLMFLCGVMVFLDCIRENGAEMIEPWGVWVVVSDGFLVILLLVLVNMEMICLIMSELELGTMIVVGYFGRVQVGHHCWW